MKTFISYSQKDLEFVQALYQRLTRDGVECFFDKASIAWGSNWVVELEKGLDEAEAILLVLSPDFCKSEWTKLERTSIMARRDKPIYPLALKPCGDLLPRLLAAIQSIDVSTDRKFEECYPQICGTLGGKITSLTTPTDRTKIPPVATLPDRSLMPYRSLGAGFVGRVEALWKLHDLLREQKTTIVEGVGVIMGTGGLGKTQTAIEYVHRFGVNYPGGVFWIEAEQGKLMMISRIAEFTGIRVDNKLPEKDQLNALWRGLSKDQAVLIVLDNFPEDEPLQPWLPALEDIYLLVTTRRKDLKYARLPLEFLSVAEGIQLLNSGERKFGFEAGQLVELLGGLPLALELTRHFLNLRPELTIAKLVDDIGKMGELKALEMFAERYQDELPTGHIKEIAATFQIGWEQCSEFAQTVLQSIALMAPTPVPRRLLRRIFASENQSSIEDPLDNALSELVNRVSMIELDEVYDPVMHRLISGLVRTTISEENDLPGKVVQAIIKEMKRVEDECDTSAFRELEKIVPHTEFLLGLGFSGVMTAEQSIAILDYLTTHHREWGRYRIAHTYGLKAMDLSQKHYSPDHPDIVDHQLNLALVLQELGEYEEARDLLRKALASDQRNFEPGHPNIAMWQSNLALVLQDLGEYKEARDLLQDALASAERHFEPGHSDIAVSQSNLAVVLQDLGKCEEARDLLRDALASDEQNFEPSHPNIAMWQSNLALVLQDLGEYEEARDLLREALASNQRVFEPGHPAIARSQSNLATVLQDLGEYEEARDLLWEALASEKRNYEPDHPAIAICQWNLALALQYLGEYEEAHELSRQAYQTLLKRLGPEHPDTKRVKEDSEGMLAPVHHVASIFRRFKSFISGKI